MIEDGVRLSYSIFGDNANIINMLTGETLIVSGTNIVCANLSPDIVTTHIKNLTEVLMSSKRSRSLVRKHDFTERNNLTVREENHGEYTISFRGSGCTVKNNMVICYRGFDFDDCLKAINGLLAKLVQSAMPLKPKRDIVRRIADVGVLVWVYNGHTVITYEDHIMGNYMFNCLIDARFYDGVIVSTSRADDKAYILDKHFNVIVEFPLDGSIESYYPCDDESFED